MAQRKLLFAHSNIYRTILPYFLASKVFGFAAFSIGGPPKNWFCSLSDLFFLFLSIVGYTLTAYSSVKIHSASNVYGSQIQFLGKMIFFLGKFCVTVVCILMNFLMRRKIVKLFYEIDDVDKGLAQCLNVKIQFDKQRKFSVLYLTFSTIFLMACGISAKVTNYKLELPLLYIILQIFNTLSFAIFTGQFSLVILSIQKRFSCLNSVFR